MFCPTAQGPCQGRSKCRLWIRGRILYTDTKLLAAKLARFTLSKENHSSPKTITSEIHDAFWKEQGLSNIQREVLLDRYLREKVIEVEQLAQQWIQSPGFHETILDEK